MAESEMFESSLRTCGDLAGVFECDGETGYFYLYEERANEGQKVAGAIHVLTGSPDFGQEDVSVVWDTSERFVGLFIRRQLWAVFEGQNRAKHGGDYLADSEPLIPKEIVRAFES
jgi:hypothetical protein